MPDQIPRFVVQTYDGERCVVVDTRWNTPIRMGKIFERDLANVIAETLNRRPYAQAQQTTAAGSGVHRQKEPQRSGNAASDKPADSVSARTRVRSPSGRDNGTVPGTMTRGLWVDEYTTRGLWVDEYREPKGLQVSIDRRCERCDGDTLPFSRIATGELLCGPCYRKQHPRQGDIDAQRREIRRLSEIYRANKEDDQ